MTKTLAELIDRAYDIKINFGVAYYVLHHYEKGSYVDFLVTKIYNLPKLIELAGGLKLKMIGKDGNIIVRLFERDDEDVNG